MRKTFTLTDIEWNEEQNGGSGTDGEKGQHTGGVEYGVLSNIFSLERSLTKLLLLLEFA